MHCVQLRDGKETDGGYKGRKFESMNFLGPNPEKELLFFFSGVKVDKTPFPRSPVGLSRHQAIRLAQVGCAGTIVCCESLHNDLHPEKSER